MCEVLQIIICFIEIIFPFWVGVSVFQRRYLKLASKIFLYLGVGILTMLLCYQRHFVMFSRLFLVFTLVVSSILFWRYFKTSFLKSILISSIYHESIYVMDLIGIIVMDFSKGEEGYADFIMRNITHDRIIIYVLSRLFILLFCYILIHKYTGILTYFDNHFMIVAFPILEYISLVQCDGIFYGKNMIAARNLYLFLLVYVVMIFLLIIQYIKSKSDYIRKLNDEKTRLIEADYKRIVVWNRQREIFIHDANKHYIILENLLVDNEKDRALQYVKTLKEDVKKIARKITTGNIVLDSVLNEKLVQIEDEGIELSIEIDSMEDTFIKDQEWCVIVTNLLDNAIEAVKIENEKFIGIYLKRKESGIIIHIENSFTGKINIDGEEIKTTKKENKTHGWGLWSVRQVVERYAGVMNYEHKDNVFHVYIMLYG